MLSRKDLGKNGSARLYIGLLLASLPSEGGTPLEQTLQKATI